MSGRTLLVFDASSGAAAVYEAELEVLSGRVSEIFGLFVEDINLFALASLPCAVEVGFPVSVEVRPDVSRLERELKVRQRQTREAIAELARRGGLPWRFEIVRGEVIRELIAASENVDQILLMSRNLDRRRKAIERVSEPASRKLRSLPNAGRHHKPLATG